MSGYGDRVERVQIIDILPVTPIPRTNTSALQSRTGVGSWAESDERTNRKPQCWKKCLRKANLAKRDASAPVEIKEPPFLGRMGYFIKRVHPDAAMGVVKGWALRVRTCKLQET